MAVVLEEGEPKEEAPAPPGGSGGPAIHVAWIQGIGATALRRVCLQVIGFGASIILAGVLTPAEFGLYYIANFYVTLLGTLQTTQMAGALIAAPEPPTRVAERTLFTVEQGMSVVAIALLSAAGLAIHRFPALEPVRPAYFYILALSGVWFINGFAVIPTVHLSRAVQFTRLAVADGLAQFSFYVAAVAIALAGGGPWSFVAATLLQAAVRSGLLSWFSPWRPGLAFCRKSARHYLGAGLSLQASALTHLARENMSPGLGALVYGSTGVGFYGWAANLAGVAQIPAHIFGQLSYATYARLQHEPHTTARVLGFTFRVTTLLGGLAMVVLLGFGDHVVHFVYGDKWRPALPVLYLCTATTPLALFISPQMQRLIGTWQHQLAFRINLGWTAGVALLALVLVLALRLSYFGMAAAYAAGLAVVAVLFFAASSPELRHAALATLSRFGIALGAALGVAYLLRPFVTSFLTLAAASGAALAVYAGLTALFFARTVRSDYAWFRQT
jgi:O-antigen/teichoic acid export membrane protein